MNEIEIQSINLSEIFEALKKRWIIIVAITLSTTLVAIILSFFIIRPTYEASTKVFIGKETSNLEAYSNNDIQMYQKLLQTYSETVKTNEVIQTAINNTNANLTVKDVKNNLTVTPISDTQILQIKYKSKNSEEAELVLRNITNEFIVLAKELVPNGNVRVIESVQLPEIPIAPNKKLNIAISFLLGLIMSIGTVFVLEYLDNTFKTKESLEKELEIPVVGLIPLLNEKNLNNR